MTTKYTPPFPLVALLLIVLLAGCDSTNSIENITENDIASETPEETRLEWESNREEQQAYIQSMSYFDPEKVKTIDDRMAEIADEIPGFAGYYLEPTDPGLLDLEITDFETARMIADNMRPVVRMTNPDRLAASIHTDLRQALSEFHDMDTAMRDYSEFIIRPAKYNFRQLQDWLRSIKGYDGMISIRIDEVNNRIEVGVLEEKYVGHLRK